MGIFQETPGQLTPQYEVEPYPKFELIRDVLVVLVIPKNEEDPIKNEVVIFPIITQWELSVAMETRVPIRPGPKPNAPFLPPQ